MMPITKRSAGCDGDHKSVESDPAAVRKPLHRGELPFKEVLPGEAKRLFVTAIMAALLCVRHNVVHPSLSNQKEKS